MTQPKSSASSQGTGNGSTKLHTPPVTRATSPYGTRSRNRGAASRVNYAEDKDNEMDYDYTTAPSASTNTAASSQSIGNTVVNGGSSRRASAATTAATKEALGTSHSTKKRKGTFVQPKEKICNMYSFNNPVVKDGVLTADDGTTFSVNGMNMVICARPTFSLQLLSHPLFSDYFATSNPLPLESCRTHLFDM